MGIQTSVRMDAEAVAAFLNEHQTGLLSLARDDDAYGIPVAYNYRRDDERLYFRFGFAPGSRKREFADATEQASFCVYDEVDGRWTSVVASGRLVELAANDLESRIVENVEQLRIPFYKVFDRPTEEMEFAIVALEIDDLHGIFEGAT
jgi:hypothetical protein